MGWRRADYVPEIYNRHKYFFAATPFNLSDWNYMMSRVPVTAGTSPLWFSTYCLSYTFALAIRSDDCRDPSVLRSWKLAALGSVPTMSGCSTSSQNTSDQRSHSLHSNSTAITDISDEIDNLCASLKKAVLSDAYPQFHSSTMCSNPEENVWSQVSGKGGWWR